MLSKAERLQPSSFWNALVFNSSSNSAMASLSSSKLKNVRFRSRAMIQRCATNTPASTFALSLGFRGRAGIMPIP